MTSLLVFILSMSAMISLCCVEEMYRNRFAAHALWMQNYEENREYHAITFPWMAEKMAA